MPSLSRKDLEKLNHVVTGIYAFRAPEEFFAAVLPVVKNLFSSDFASYNEYDARRRLSKAVHGSPDHEDVFKEHEPALKAYLPMHPFFRVSSFHRCTTLSDVWEPAAFKRTALYNEYYRHLDVQAQMITELSTRPRGRAIVSLSRSKPDYSARERLLMQLLHPHIANAYRIALMLHHYRERIAFLEKGADLPELRTFGLTNREAQILEWAAMGKTSAEIAFILDISKRTVEKHLERVYEKLGVETKIAAVSMLMSAVSRPSPPIEREESP